MKRIYFFILFVLFFVAPTHLHAREYSIDDLYRLALERSESIKIAEDDLFISQQVKNKARSVLFPTLSAFGTHTRYSGKKTSEFGLLQPKSTNQWGLRLDQSLSISGRELTALKMTKEGIRKSGYDLDAFREAYLLNVASSYYDLLKSIKALEIAGANVDRLTKHRNAAATRLKVGNATKTVLLRAEAELAGSIAEHIKAENSQRFAKTVLARTVGISSPYDVKEPLFDRDTASMEQELLDMLTGDCRSASIDCLKERAYTERYEIKTADSNKQIAKDDVKYTRGSYWPDLALEGVYVREENDPSTSFGRRERAYGALKLVFPFFEGGLRIAEVGEAKARLRQADYGLDDAKHSVGVEVEEAYLNLLTTSAVLDQLQAEVEYASDNYNAVSKQFQYGLADSIDVMDANTLLVTAERKLANAEYDYQLAILILKRATGTLLKTILSGQPSAISKKPGE